MAQGQETTTKFKVDISELKSQMQEAQRQIRLANSEFKAATSGMDSWGKSADGVSAKIKQLETTLSSQKTILNGLEEQYREIADAQGEGSKGAQELLIKINNQKSAIGKTEKELRNYNETLADLDDESNDAEKGADQFEESLDDVADSADKAESMVSKLASGLKGGLVAGFKGIAGAAAGVVTAFLASAEASAEYIEDMGKLETAFTSAGHTAEVAQESYRGMVGILGETDQSVEAVNHLAKLTQSEEELAQWTDIAAGIYGTFGDSLPLEGLTEAANETAKVAAVTGPLADALNWAGVSEDAFNNILAACNDEQERSTLITSTLTRLYGEAGQTYQEVNGDLIASRQAQSDLNSAMAEAGKVAMPIMTTFKQLGANLLTDFLPAIKEIGTSFTGLLAGDAGSASALGESISNVLVQALGKITEVLPSLAETGVSLVSALGEGIVQAVPTLLSTAGSLTTFMWDSIMSGAPKLIEAGAGLLINVGKGLVTGIPDFVSNALDTVDQFADMLTISLPVMIDAGINFITNLAIGLAEALPVFIEKAPEIISKFANLINDNAPKLLKAAANIVLTLVKGILSAIPTLIANIPKIITAIVDVWDAFNWINLGSKAITFLKDGILNMVGAVKTAGGNILETIVSAFKNLPQTLADLGSKAVTFLSNGVQNMAGTIRSAATNILNIILNTIKALPSQMLSIGKNVVQGLWNGISDMTGWIIGKIKGFGDSVLSGIKSFFGIHSPSSLMADEVGEPIAEGVAEGIENKAEVVADAMDNIGDVVMGSTENMLMDVAAQHNASLNSEREYWAAMTSISSNAALKQQEAVAALIDTDKDLQTNVSALYNNYLEQLTTTTDQLMGSVGIFDEVTRSTEVNSSTLMKNMQSQVTAYADYWNVMASLNARIKDEGLQQAISQMGIDSLDELNALNSMTDGELTQYAALYNQKYALCNAIAQQSLTGLRTETENQLAKMLGVSSVNLTEFATMFNGSLESIEQYVKQTVSNIGELESDMRGYGVDIMGGLIGGIESQQRRLDQVVQNAINSAAAAARAAAQINSPSKLFSNKVGKFIPAGIAEGITKNARVAYDSVRDVVGGTLSAAKKGMAGANYEVGTNVKAHNGANAKATSSVVNNYEYTQNNTSPKALSRLDIYRQTKNLINATA
uniref:hypothetical protein n=1 Tax=Eisenbergiella sp. TaxID=1924109 RepID=UPI003AB113DE